MSIKNVEIKCLVANLDTYRGILNEKNARFVGVDKQTDTYFNVNNGRLKLRKGNVENSLIYYDRVETNGLKESNVELERLDEKTNLRNILKKSLGINIEVTKTREIYFLDNIKIHLDTVDDLGFFIEIEAIDNNERLSIKELNSQCEGMIELFNLNEKNFMAHSYSDFLKAKENSEYSLYEKEAKFFYKELMDIIPEEELISNKFMDHLCYRVSTQESYKKHKGFLEKIGVCLVEAPVSGRLISTYKLSVPIILKDRAVYLIELPSPKDANNYKDGFEHAEFVIKESFDDFSEKHNFDFDWKGTKKEHNPELRLKMNNISIKFHHTQLEQIIAQELAAQS